MSPYHAPNPDLIETFNRDGVLHLPGVLSQAAVDELTAAADTWIASDFAENRQKMRDGESDGFRNCINLDPTFVQLLANETVLPYLTTLLGPDIHLLTSHIIYRSPAQKDLPAHFRCPGWHRDFAKAQRSLGDERIQRLDIKVAYCLNDLPEPGCGGTLFVPGSHLLREKLAIPADADPAGAIEPAVKAGDAILFENRTWHAGGPNFSANTRKVIMFGYTYVWIKPSDYHDHKAATTERAEALFGSIGQQLLGTLPEPVAFDFDYDSQPLREWVPGQKAASSGY